MDVPLFVQYYLPEEEEAERRARCAPELPQLSLDPLRTTVAGVAAKLRTTNLHLVP